MASLFDTKIIDKIVDAYYLIDYNMPIIILYKFVALV